MEKIYGDRILIRELELSDLNKYIELQTNDLVGNYLSWLPVSKQQAKDNFFKAFKQQTLKNRTQYFMAIEEIKSSCFVGSVGASLVNGEFGIGWFVLPTFWGRGYASESALLFKQFFFENLKEKYIYASCDKLNIGSQRVMSKAGFNLVQESETRLFYRTNHSSVNSL